MSGAIDLERFEAVQREAEAIIVAGRWTSGPSDLLSVIGRQRDELMHSRLVGWLLGPTNQHGLGRLFLTGFVDRLWPGENLFRSDGVLVETETTRWAADDLGSGREGRADIVVHGDRTTVLIENKVDAGEQHEQCERLYWAWADHPTDTRWVSLTPTGRPPVTALSAPAVAAWKTMGYAQLRKVLSEAIETAAANRSIGRSSALQYLATLDDLASFAR